MLALRCSKAVMASTTEEGNGTPTPKSHLGELVNADHYTTMIKLQILMKFVNLIAICGVQKFQCAI